MSSVHTDRLAKLRRSVDRAYGEDWIFRPMARASGPNAAASADPSRAVVDPLVGLYEERPALAFDSARVASFAPTPSAGSAPVVHLVVPDFDIRAGDHLERKSSGEVFMLSEPRRSGFGRVAWRLTSAQ